jgi:transcriptional regulator with GAF, ATPase, and Fis domain
MARLGVSKKKKNPSTTALSQLKKELQSVSEQLESCKRELAEGRERETATGEILRVIARSPTDLQSVLDAITESVAELCEATDASLYRAEGNVMRHVARHGYPTALRIGETRPITRGLMSGRVMIDGQTLHIHDLLSEIHEYPDARAAQQLSDTRTYLATPLLREGSAIGCIVIRRNEVRPFTEKQIALLKTFADQAVIAIENVRLFQELKHRTAELETSNVQLTEALEQQTATSEILGVIASSPTDTQPVLDVVAENAARLCEASDAQILRIDGDILRLAASYGPLPSSQTRPINRQLVSGRAVIDRQTIHVHDIAVAEDEFPYTRTVGIPRGIRTSSPRHYYVRANRSGLSSFAEQRSGRSRRSRSPY